MEAPRSQRELRAVARRIDIDIVSTRRRCTMLLVLTLLLVILLLGALPIFPNARNWRPRPVGAIGMITMLGLILWLIHIV